jgi:stage V sporulation protein B
LTGSQTLWWGTLTLTAAALLSRGLGMVYRVLLARYLGAEGLGLFQMVFPFYITLVTLVAAGIPVAVSQLAAEGRAAPRVIWRDARRLTFLPAVVLMVAVLVFARPLAVALYRRPDLAPLLSALTPALAMVAVSAVLRGLFIARQSMVVPAASQVVEQVTRVALLLAAMAAGALPWLPRGALLAAWLIPVGELASLAVLWVGRRGLLSPTGGPGRRSVMRPLLNLAVPVTLNRLLSSLVGLIEATLIPLRLQASGLTPAGAVAAFGQLMGMAFPLVFFPTALTFSLATNLVPAVARQMDQPALVRRRALEALHGTALWACPVTALLLSLGSRLDDALFDTHLPPHMFLPLAAGGFFMYFDIILGGVLRGMGRTDLPLRNSLIASAAQLALIALLAGQPGRGLLWVTLAMAIGFVASFVLDAVSLSRLARFSIPWLTLLARPAAAAALAAALAPLVAEWTLLRLGDWGSLTLGLLAAGGFYAALLQTLGVHLRRG